MKPWVHVYTRDEYLKNHQASTAWREGCCHAGNAASQPLCSGGEAIISGGCFGVAPSDRALRQKGSWPDPVSNPCCLLDTVGESWRHLSLGTLSLKNVFVHILFGKHRETQRDLPCPKACHSWGRARLGPGWGQAGSRSEEFQLGVPWGWQGPRYLKGLHWQEAGSEVG